jgi:hypothetical protein
MTDLKMKNLQQRFQSIWSESPVQISSPLQSVDADNLSISEITFYLSCVDKKLHKLIYQPETALSQTEKDEIESILRSIDYKLQII